MRRQSVSSRGDVWTDNSTNFLLWTSSLIFHFIFSNAVNTNSTVCTKIWLFRMMVPTCHLPLNSTKLNPLLYQQNYCTISEPTQTLLPLIINPANSITVSLLNQYQQTQTSLLRPQPPQQRTQTSRFRIGDKIIAALQGPPTESCLAMNCTISSFSNQPLVLRKFKLWSTKIQI